MRLIANAALGLALLGAAPAIAQEPAGERAQEAVYDAPAAWAEFEQLLRDKYAYIEREDLDVEAQLARSRALAASAKDADETRLLIHQTALTFMDPHLIIGPFTREDYAIIMTSADLAMTIVEGRAIIADVRRTSPAFEAGLRPGMEITRIGGEPALEAARKPFGPVLPEPNSAQLEYGLTLAANGKLVGDRELELAGPLGAVTLENTRDFSGRLNNRDLVDLRFVGQAADVAVLTPLNSLGNNDTIKAFDAAMEKAKGARAIILDVRETPSGGNTEVGRSIIGHFATRVAPYQMHRIPAFEREFTVPRQFVEYVYPREPAFTGPVIVLHGKWTGSMGEGIVIGMDAASDAVTIGSDMGDLLGGLWNYTLEISGARVDLGGEALFHVDGRPREDYRSDIEIYPASSAPDGSDPAIARALEYLADETD